MQLVLQFTTEKSLENPTGVFTKTVSAEDIIDYNWKKHCRGDDYIYNKKDNDKRFHVGKNYQVHTGIEFVLQPRRSFCGRPFTMKKGRWGTLIKIIRSRRRKAFPSYNWCAATTGVTRKRSAVLEGQHLNSVWKKPKRKRRKKEKKNVFQVEALLGTLKMGNNQTFYRVKWVGYDEITNEPRSVLIQDIPEMVKSFEAGVSAMASSTLRDLYNAAVLV